MQNVRDIIRELGEVVGVSPIDTVHDAAVLMNEKKIGSVVVLKDGAMVGILTERDILTRVVADLRDPEKTLVEDVMTGSVLTAAPDTTLAEARAVMRRERIRHLPVVENGTLVGMISIGDLNLVKAEAMAETIRYMESYIAGGGLI